MKPYERLPSQSLAGIYSAVDSIDLDSMLAFMLLYNFHLRLEKGGVSLGKLMIRFYPIGNAERSLNPVNL